MDTAIFDQIEGLVAVLWEQAEETDEFVRRTAALKNRLAALEAHAGSKLAATDTWRRAGARSAEHHHAFVTGVSVAAARSALTTVESLPSLPSLEQAVRTGQVSPAQAAPIAQAACADPRAESRLVAYAGIKPLAALRDECDRVKTAACSDDHARIHADRCVRVSKLGDGAHQLTYRSTGDEVATVVAAVRAKAKEIFDCARRAGRREPEEAYMADALLALAKGDGKPGAGPQLIVRVDLDALLRGHPAEGEVCEIPGTGPIPAAAARAMAETGDAFLSAIATRGEDVVAAVNIGRKPTKLQETALRWLQPTCTNEACGATWRLETDHRVPWAEQKLTLLALLDPLCHHDHLLKTTKNWALVEGKGKRAFVPPDDPRHPDNTS